MSVNISKLTNSEIRNKIHWGIERTNVIRPLSKKEWHKAVNRFHRPRLLWEYEMFRLKGWFDEK